MPRAKVFSEARIQPGEFALITVKSISKVVGVLSSLNLLKLVKQHHFVMQSGATPSRKRVWRQ